MDWATEVNERLENATENVWAVIRQATDQELEAGALWYADTRADLRAIASDTGLSFSRVCNVAAQLSPACKVDDNIREARLMCERAAADADLVGLTFHTYNRNRDAAWEIARNGGEPSGPKVSRFARNLRGDEDTVTIDRHAFNAACGAELIVNKRGPKVTPRRYKLAAAAYHEVAGALDLSPAQVQAIAWLTWKRIIGR